MDLYLGKLISIFFRIGGYFGLALLAITIINSIYGPPVNDTDKLARRIRSMDYKHGKFKQRPREIDATYKLGEKSCKPNDKISGKMVQVKEEPNVEWEEKWVRQNGRLRKMILIH